MKILWESSQKASTQIEGKRRAVGAASGHRFESAEVIRRGEKFIKMPLNGLFLDNREFSKVGRTLELAIKRRVMDAGIPEGNIGIDDRGVRRNPIFQKATAIINARPARTHHWSGMGGCVKNPIMFVPIPPAYHGDSCADLALLWKRHNLIERTKLNILLMLNPLFHGIGPHHYSDKYVWEYKGILVSQDPVAVDAIGVRILQAKRREFFGEERPLKPPAKHIFLADTRHSLGVSDPNQIELIKLGWEEGILI